MADISDTQAVLKSLKVIYKDGMTSLLARDGSAVKLVPFEKAEGKAYNFSAIAGRGGAVAADYTEALKKAADKGVQAEYSVTPGQCYAVYSINKKELAAGRSNLGAYVPLLKRGFYRSTAGLRKTLSAAFYGRGFGEVAVVGTAVSSLSVGASANIPLQPSETQKLDIGTAIVFKEHISDPESVTASTNPALATATVTKLLGGMKGVTVTIDALQTSVDEIPVGSILCIAGSVVPGTNKPLLPVGLDGWIPMVAGRDESDSDWTSYIAADFFGQNRSAAPDRMAGSFYAPAGFEKKLDSLQNALTLNRAAGGDANIILMNTFDRADLAKEINTQTTYFAPTDSKRANRVSVGNEDLSVSMSTNLVDLIVDDIDCPIGKFYVGSRESWSMLIWFANQNQNKDDGISATEPGKQQVDDLEDFDFANGTSKLNIEDYITVEPGTGTYNGPAVNVTLGFCGGLCITDPSAWVVGLFYDPAGYSGVLGYSL